MKKILISVLALFMVYAASGFFILPYVYQQAFERLANQSLGRRLQLESIRLNPFTFSGTARQVALYDTDGSPVLTASRVEADGTLLGFWSQSGPLRTLVIHQPALLIEGGKAGRGRLDRLLSDLSAAAVHLPERPIIEALSLVDGALSTVDQKPDSERVVLIDSINLSTDSLGPSGAGSLELRRGDAQHPDFRVKGNVTWSVAGEALILELDQAMLSTEAIEVKLGQLTATPAESLEADFTMSIAADREGLRLLNSSIRTNGFTVQYAPVDAKAAYRLPVDRAELTLSDFGPGRMQDGQFDLLLSTRPAGQVRLSNKAGLGGQAGNAVFLVSGVPISSLVALQQDRSTLEISTGILTAEGAIQYQDSAAAVSAELLIEDLEVVDSRDGARPLTLKRLAARGVHWRYAEEIARVQSVALEQPRVKIDPGGEPGSLRLLAGDTINRIAVDRISINEGRIELLDGSDSRSPLLLVDHLRGEVTHFGANQVASIVLDGQANSAGSLQLRGETRPFDGLQFSEFEVDLINLDASIADPFTLAHGGRAIDSGALDMHLDIRVAGHQLTGTQTIALTNLQLGEPSQSAPAASLPLDLAVALLQDANEHIRFSVNVSGRVNRLFPDIRSAADREVADYLARLGAEPMAALADLAGSDAEHLAAIPFEPGQAALTSSGMERLDLLGSALLNRPGLSIQVSGAYDPVTDRRAMARQQVRLHVLLATAAEPSFRTPASAIRFSDFKVQNVLDEFAGARLGAEQVNLIAAQFSDGESAAGSAIPEARREAYYAALFDALVDNESIDDRALLNLARYRTQAVSGQLIKLGVAKNRLINGESTVVAAVDSSAVPAFLEVGVVVDESGP